MEAAGSASFVAADLSTPEGPRTLIAAAVERGGVDVLVNNAGAVTPRFDGILSVTDEDWDAALSLNFLSAVRATREAVPHMLSRGGGSIVMIGSVNATLPEWNIVDYSATKAALANYAKSLSKEFGPKGIRVNTISPGPVATDLWLADDGVAAQFAAASGATPDEVVSSVVAGSATGRFTTPQEVADLTVFLASDRSANITGSDVRIDGGYVTTRSDQPSYARPGVRDARVRHGKLSHDRR